MVLTYDSWRHDYDSDPGVIGRKIIVSKSPFTIIGVASKGFYGTERFLQPRLWVDVWNAPQLGMAGEIESRSSEWAFVIGRRKAAITRGQAAADLNRVAHELAREYPQTDENDRFVLAEPGYIGNMMGPALHAFLGGVLLLAALVLLAACANLGSLYAARAADRRRDIAIRMALGATRGRVTSELMVESVLLGLVGGALGCLLARVVLQALTSYRPPFEFPVAVVVEPHAAVYGFAFLLAVMAGLLCGIVPAREARRTELHEVMKSGATGAGERGRRWTVRDALLLIEVMLCCVLVTASVVSLRGLVASRRMALGFDPKGVVMVAYNLSIAGYKDEDTVRFSRKLAEDAAALPGVESAAFASNTPLNTGNDTDSIYRIGTTELRPSNRLFSSLDYDISPGYLRTAGTTLLEGRDFTWADDAKAPRVAVVNHRFAQMVFGERSALGESFVGPGKKPVRIVGIVEDGKYLSMNEAPTPAAFYPMAQGTGFFTRLLVRLQPGARDEGPRISNAVTALLHNQDPAVPVSFAGSWLGAMGPILFPARAATVALGVLGGLALVLALTGIFGLASYTVTRRMRELGIRVALGAARVQLLRTALGRVGRVVLLGSVAGLAAGLASTRLLAAIVYGARATDPWVLLSVAVTMACVGCVATAVPARRALRVEPVILLREE